MNLAFSADELAFQAEVRAFIHAHFPPERPFTHTKADIDRWAAALNARGWAAYKWPVQFGGTGWDVTRKYIWERECALAGVPERLGGMGMMMLAPILYGYGTPEQQRRHLPGILANEVEWCQGYSEPGAGSDLAALRTSAVRDGDHYIVSGEKIWTSYAHIAHWMFALVRTSTGARKQEGITFLLIDMASPGITVRPIVTIDGRHHSLNAVVLDNVRVPVENRIGEEGRGWTYAKGLLTHERTGLAYVAQSVRRLRLLKERAAEMPDGRGGRLADDPAFRAKLAAVEIDLLALEFTELRTLAETAVGSAPGAQSSILKSRGSVIFQRLTELEIECAGPFALPYPPGVLAGTEPPVGPDWAQEEMATYLLARSTTIAGGTEEVQRGIIAKHVLGL
ncbi:MAG TPA: acyl-CoA dehydrogenase family protein [Azospirillaceae bacterium]|nr:acyl-CoA dehydrogenase family protein [Azospirillaceae bacterium]